MPETRIVMYRIGVNRETYHHSGTCRYLLHHPQQHPDQTWAAVPEHEAQAEPLNLRPCTHCCA